MEILKNEINNLEKRNLLLEEENSILKSQRNFLKGMIEWMVEAHGESVTTDYTIPAIPWKLKDYVSTTLKEGFEDIDYRNKASKVETEKE